MLSIFIILYKKLDMSIEMCYIMFIVLLCPNCKLSARSVETGCQCEFYEPKQRKHDFTVIFILKNTLHNSSKLFIESRFKNGLQGILRLVVWSYRLFLLSFFCSPQIVMLSIFSRQNYLVGNRRIHRQNFLVGRTISSVERFSWQN